MRSIAWSPSTSSLHFTSLHSLFFFPFSSSSAGFGVSLNKNRNSSGDIAERSSLFFKHEGPREPDKKGKPGKFPSSFCWMGGSRIVPGGGSWGGVYIDDVIADFIASLQGVDEGLSYPLVEPEYKVTLGELADQIKAYKRSRTSLLSEPVGAGFVRALYSTYVSYLKPDQFSYSLLQHADERGIFVEMLKTKESGQFSYFSAHPGVTRGGHYHHTKTEKFLVIKGTAKFGFRDIVTDERFEIVTSGDELHVVDTVPGWTHDITNIGDDEMLVMLWANEIFDREQPDTVVAKV